MLCHEHVFHSLQTISSALAAIRVGLNLLYAFLAKTGPLELF